MANKAMQWKRKEVTVTFPSGNTAVLRRPNVTSLISKDGNIPNSLYRMITGNGTSLKMTDDEQKEHINGILYIVEKLAKDAFVSPKVVNEPNYENDEIGIDDIPDNDKFFLMDWAVGGGDADEALARFLSANQTK